MSRTHQAILAAAVSLAVLAGCAKGHESGSMERAADAGSADMPAEMAGAAVPQAAMARDAAPAPVETAGVDASRQLASSSATASVTDPQRRFVRTAQAGFQVKDVYEAALSVEDAVAAEGGFVVSNRIETQTLGSRSAPAGNQQLRVISEVRTTGELVVRVPSERTQSFLRAIARQMKFLDARNFEANDVQFEMLRRQLGQARAQELQQDIRAASQQPGRTGDKVDAIQAREQMLAARDEAVVAQRELEDRIAFATLRLTLRQGPGVREDLVPDTDAIMRERGPGLASRIGEGLRRGWSGLLAVLVGLVYLWPLWIALAAGFALLRGWRRMRRNRARNDTRPARDSGDGA